MTARRRETRRRDAIGRASGRAPPRPGRDRNSDRRPASGQATTSDPPPARRLRRPPPAPPPVGRTPLRPRRPAGTWRPEADDADPAAAAPARLFSSLSRGRRSCGRHHHPPPTHHPPPKTARSARNGWAGPFWACAGKVRVPCRCRPWSCQFSLLSAGRPRPPASAVPVRRLFGARRCLSGACLVVCQRLSVPVSAPALVLRCLSGARRPAPVRYPRAPASVCHSLPPVRLCLCLCPVSAPALCPASPRHVSVQTCRVRVLFRGQQRLLQPPAGALHGRLCH